MPQHETGENEYFASLIKSERQAHVEYPKRMTKIDSSSHDFHLVNVV